MRKVIITTCIVIGLLEVMLVIAYFSIFNGAISTDHQDWNTFLQIFNGFVMAVLTAVNIYIFYQLTVAIEDKNQKRAVKEKIFVFFFDNTDLDPAEIINEIYKKEVFI